MRLTDDKRAMLAGEAGPVRQWAIEHQMHVGRCLGAPGSDQVSRAHMIADTGYNPIGSRLLDAR